MYNSEEDIFSLTDDLSSSYVDPDNLISSYQDKFPIGMSNFRATRKPNQENPLFKNSAFNRYYSPSPQALARQRWKSAYFKVKYIKDPWADFKLQLYPTQICVRHRYNAIKKEWVKDECMIKLEPKQFANGAMRACFRMKKLSKTVHTVSWERASNYVAKSYILQDEFTREDYFNDVKLQMDAKLWAEIYNRHNPPKKIDMFQVSVLEFADGRLFHLEHFIDGKYIKYNSNSGFVEDVHVRNTPQAFSHFTFESSGHELIVVDVQGVGDLYTDPQIHTSRGTEYGEGNLGIKGIALFFSNHICNDVCRSLGLSQFDLAKQEFISNTKCLNQVQKSCLTTFRQTNDTSDCSNTNSANNYHPATSPFYDSFSRVRHRVFSETSVCSENSNSTDLPDISESEGYESSSPISPKSQTNPISVINNSITKIPSMPIAMSPMVAALRCQGRVRNESHCLDSAFSMDEAVSYFNSKNRILKLRSSSVAANTKASIHDSEFEESSDYSFSYNMMDEDGEDDEEESVLGRVHLELAKYHVLGRFCKNIYEEFDQEVAFFHLEQAAKLGVAEAMSSVGKICLQLPNDILPEYEAEESEANRQAGFDLMLGSADKGDKGAMLIVAKMLDTGVGLGKKMSQDWLKSVEYYQRVVNASVDENGEELDDSIYLVLARMAEMNLKGGFGLESDPSEAYSLYNEAAEKAMAFGKGRLANKYYELAEEASAACDAEDEDDF